MERRIIGGFPRPTSLQARSLLAINAIAVCSFGGPRPCIQWPWEFNRSIGTNPCLVGPQAWTR